jgi:hypothetical protein
MPIHDWTRVTAGIFHHFHQQWISDLCNRLNAGLLPQSYYALQEQVVGELGPDVLALELGPANTEFPEESSSDESNIALAEPKVRFTAETELDYYSSRQSTVVIRHTSGDRLVALIEIVSPGNKSSKNNFRTFIHKVADALTQGYHLLIVDVHPPTKPDPNGIHGAIWEEIADDLYQQPEDKQLTLATYRAGFPKKAFVEPVAVGDTLPDMALFLSRNYWINVPLEASYEVAWKNLPRRWQIILEGSSANGQST